MKIKVSDVTRREEHLIALLAAPRTIEEIARLLKIKVPSAKMALSRLRKKRDICTLFQYGGSRYQLVNEQKSA